MIGCFWVRRRMWLLIGGELSPSRVEKVQSHLDRCEKCRTRFEELENWMVTVRAPDPETRSISEHQWFWGRLKNRINTDITPAPIRKPAGPFISRWVPILSSGLVLTAAVVIVSNNWKENRDIRALKDYVAAASGQESPTTIDLTEGEMKEDGVIIYQVPNPEMTIIYFTETGD